MHAGHPGLEVAGSLAELLMLPESLPGRRGPGPPPWEVRRPRLRCVLGAR